MSRVVSSAVAENIRILALQMVDALIDQQQHQHEMDFTMMVGTTVPPPFSLWA
jgi:hypothetical protein